MVNQLKENMSQNVHEAKTYNIRCIKWIENDPTENNREQPLLPDGVGSHVAIRCDKNTPHQESFSLSKTEK